MTAPPPQKDAVRDGPHAMKSAHDNLQAYLNLVVVFSLQ